MAPRVGHEVLKAPLVYEAPLDMPGKPELLRLAATSVLEGRAAREAMEQGVQRDTDEATHPG
jgi:hypothetical protein